MQKRLIDANALLKSIKNNWWLYRYEVVLAPTVDAVEVVRCKDCKFYWKNDSCKFYWEDDKNSKEWVCLATPKDDAFCSEGERREDAETN